jgi:hypothetical protein
MKKNDWTKVNQFFDLCFSEWILTWLSFK